MLLILKSKAYIIQLKVYKISFSKNIVRADKDNNMLIKELYRSDLKGSGYSGPFL